MKSLTISLAPNGSFRLQLPTQGLAAPGRYIDIPATEAGIHILYNTIRDWTEDAKIGTTASPTQAQIIEALRGASWGEAKQLAGSARRRADIKAATGVTVRNKAAGKKQLSLADLGL